MFGDVSFYEYLSYRVPIIVYIAERAKKCLDFCSSVFIIHLLICFYFDVYIWKKRLILGNSAELVLVGNNDHLYGINDSSLFMLPLLYDY